MREGEVTSSLFAVDFPRQTASSQGHSFKHRSNTHAASAGAQSTSPGAQNPLRLQNPTHITHHHLIVPLRHIISTRRRPPPLQRPGGAPLPTPRRHHHRRRPPVTTAATVVPLGMHARRGRDRRRLASAAARAAPSLGGGGPAERGQGRVADRGDVVGRDGEVDYERAAVRLA